LTILRFATPHTLATLATLAVHGVLGESAPEAFRVGVLGDG